MVMRSGNTKEDKLIAELKKLYELIEDVKAIVIVGNDGLPMGNYPLDDEESYNPANSPQVAAMAATLVGLADKTLKRLEQGMLDRLLIEAEEGTMVVYPAGRNASVAVLVPRTANMGHVLFATRRIAPELEKIIDDK
jgi:predicted regulator of Ras-like GTPase activity (Roadblock/LC7/MglB family)